MTDYSEDPPILDAEQLQQYFIRIDLDKSLRSEPISPSLDLLRAIITCHVHTIPFEQLDVALGRGINTELAVVYDKIVNHGRGGYCFEGNTIFAACLRACGFKTVARAARVLAGGPGRISMHSHLIHIVSTSEDSPEYLVDMAFGKDSMRLPMPLETSMPKSMQQGSNGCESEIGEPVLMYPDAYRLIADNVMFEAPGGLILQSFDSVKWSKLQQSDDDNDGGEDADHSPAAQLEECWSGMYSFHPERPLWKADVRGGNWWVSTQLKNNWFSATRLVIKLTPEGRKIMTHYTVSDLKRVCDDDLKLLFPGETNFKEEEHKQQQVHSNGNVIERTEVTVTADEYFDTMKNEFGTDLSWDHRTGKKEKVKIASFLTQSLTEDEQNA